ncbi:hypothetical protein BT67DRAFT_434648 [Trichocladium antarcticum]|uniref:Uncharacterized protein n=1 Tax=Trichocladium antarcticum TaxID=1450529 RepID=A0AAN6ZCY0_9PEZI|nr:hypothetical protein BT67DRAFT_434648 [Trichocladium antarcticum]
MTIPSITITPPGLDDLPTPVRTFHLVTHTIAHLPICTPHKTTIWSAFIKSLDKDDHSAISAFCTDHPHNPTTTTTTIHNNNPEFEAAWPEPGALVPPHQWAAALRAGWPLDAEAGTVEENVRAVVAGGGWVGMLRECVACAEAMRPGGWCGGG